MSWLKRLVKVFGWDISSISKEDPIIAPEEPQKMHCIRFMTEKGEQNLNEESIVGLTRFKKCLLMR